MVTEFLGPNGVGKSLAKLELRDRVQAVIYTYEICLVQPSNRSPGAA
ncbi:hypothetical protein [Streptomyces massasporeus]